jgi:propionyl-CoA carboxylase alpha chain
VRSLLIANRGEIAVRIARTAHAMGIATVGVYSGPDADAVHVDAVDVAVALGGSTPAESYLRIDALLDAARRTGADAVHPGYGFLAENAVFAQAVIDAGLTWVGPAPAQITLLGDKVAAKRAAAAAGVPATEIVEVAPGSVPEGVPIPALVKAAAGGGGRGMRVVRDPDGLAGAVAAASREAESAFGDGTVFIEPFLERGRHVEVQIVGDRHGNVVHFGERECSIQRRNQKVVEEAPSAGITDEVRKQLLDGAVALARHVGYENAGTVEFLVGADGTVTFLEVNTRLQVEHPVTEAVTGLDLVALQLRVARGEPLGFTQDDVSVDGHAIEARVVAEDPAAGWLPSTGTVTAFAFGPGVRVDAGFRSGSAVSPDYDSLLAKVISAAPTRREAAGVLRRALQGTVVDGVRTNLDMLVATLAEPDYLAGDTPTAYLDEHPGVLAAAGPEGDDRLAHLVAAALADERRRRAADPVLGFAPSGWRNLRTQGVRGAWADEATGDQTEVEVWPAGPGRWELAVEVDGIRHVLAIGGAGAAITVSGRRGRTRWSLLPRFVDHDQSSAVAGPVAPLPGTVLAVNVAPGDAVGAGTVLVVLEAMKMEHEITAPADATVTAARVAAGDRVNAGDLLVELEVES